MYSLKDIQTLSDYAAELLTNRPLCRISRTMLIQNLNKNIHGRKRKTAFGLHFKVKFANMNKVNYQKILEQTIEKTSGKTMYRRCFCTVVVRRAVLTA